MTKEKPPAEQPILQKVENGLKQAVEDNPDLNWQEEGTRIRRQKYTEQAVTHFTEDDDEPVFTSSWYKFGKTYPAAPSGVNGDDGQFVSPRIQESEIFAVPLDEISQFFTHQAKEPKLNAHYWYLPTLDFLEEFYKYNAPEKYKELYLANIEFRRILSEASEEITSLRSNQTGESTSFSEFGNTQSVDYYRRVGKTAAALHMELATIPGLDEALDPVRKFTDLTEDVFMVLAEVEETELTPHHRRAVDTLEEFYNDSVWEYPAAIIMRQTAEGPSSDWVRGNAERKLDRLRDTFETNLSHTRQTCADAGLIPDSEDYPTHDDEVESAISNLMRTTDRREE